jgi:streptogramin lyase
MGFTTTGHPQRSPQILCIALILFQIVLFQMAPLQDSTAANTPPVMAPVKSPPSPERSLPLKVFIEGQVLSGSHPIKEARVYLYKSRRKADRTPITLSNPQTTDSHGRFSFHFLPPADPGLIYIVIMGGNGGGGANRSLSMNAPVWMANGAIPRTPVIRTVNSRIFSTAVATFLSALELDRIFGAPKRLSSLYVQYRGEIDLQSGQFETGGFESSLSLASQTTLSGWAHAASLCDKHPESCQGLFQEAVSGTNEVVPQNTLDFLEGAGGFPDRNQDRILKRFGHHSEKHFPMAPTRSLSVRVSLSGDPLPRSRITLTAIDLLENTQKTVATGITGHNGKVTLHYRPKPHQRFYLTAWGTIRKGLSNPAIRLIALLPSRQPGKTAILSPDKRSVPLVINELTTLAAVNSLRQAITDDRINPAPMSATGFQNGWTLAIKIVPTGSGKLSPSLSSNTLSVESALLGLCAIQTSSSCRKLFSLLSTRNHRVKNTLEAILALSGHPTSHKQEILALLPEGNLKLSDFLLKLTLPAPPSGTSCRDPHGSMAIDSRGSLWEICSGPQTLIHLSPDPRPGKPLMRISSDPIPGKGATLLTIDPRGNLWIAEKGSLMERGPSGSLPWRRFPGIGQSPLALVQDPATHTIWVSEGDALDIFDDQGKPLHRIAEAGINALASDDSSNIWASRRNESLVLEIDPDWNIKGRFKRTAGISHPSTLAIDSNGTVWIGNRNPDSMTGLSADGNPVTGSPLSGGGLDGPSAIAIDGENTLWVVNSHGNSLSAYSQDQTPLSPEGGFLGGGVFHPFDLATDGSGNLWIRNRSREKTDQAGTITLFVGAATPQTTPLSLSPR